MSEPRRCDERLAGVREFAQSQTQVVQRAAAIHHETMVRDR